MKKFFTRLFSVFSEKSSISPIERQISDIENTIGSESNDLKKLLPKGYTYRSNASVYDIYESSTGGMLNHMYFLQGEFGAKTVLLNQNYMRYLELVVPHDQSSHMELEQERRLQEARLKNQQFYSEHAKVFEKGIQAEELVAQNQIRSNALKGEVLQSEDKLKQVQNDGLSVRLRNDLVKQTLQKSKGNAPQTLKYMQKHTELYGNDELESVGVGEFEGKAETEGKTKDQHSVNSESKIVESDPIEVKSQHGIPSQGSSWKAPEKSLAEDKKDKENGKDTVYSIPGSVYPTRQVYTTDRPSFTDYFGIYHDYALIAIQNEKERNFTEQWVENKIPPYPNTDIELDLPEDMASKLTPVKENFFLANVKPFEIALIFILLACGLAVEFSSMGITLNTIYSFVSFKAIISGSTALILSKLISYLLAGPTKEFLAREGKILQWRGVRVHKMMLWILGAIFCYSVAVGYLFARNTERNRKLEDISILQKDIRRAKNQAEFADVPNLETQQSILQQEKKLEKQKAELKNYSMDMMTVISISLSNFIILLASAILFAIGKLLLSGYSLRKKIELLSGELHAIHGEFYAQKSSIHQIYLKSVRIIKLYGILEFLKKQKDFNVDQTIIKYWNEKKEELHPKAKEMNAKNPLPLRSANHNHSQNGVH
ncbi:hypothetical protein [Chryseobacterium sp. SL1]|uniref:hypothetical protein n=1 Tax=Chryseobacterium sp. SL1 TaxID=2995159 RepID=UPI0022725944|nr:hypothetical protein [Chryseobacterium sp. SL1]MCY1660119.1 hypothetical protein [Chryseobacterium sp. SL1]